MDTGARDNGLRAGNYAPVRDVDPRVVDTVLAALRQRGIAAYAVPASGTVGGSMEAKLPARPLDRLFVDDQRLDEARGVVDGETDGAIEDRDFESSWQQVLSSLQSTPTLLAEPWPERENLTLAEREAAYDDEQQARADPDDEHFVPPPPPPLPKLRPATWAALVTMALCVAVMATDVLGHAFDVLAFIVFVAAAASLVYNMRQGPPDDDGWDDGAVL